MLGCWDDVQLGHREGWLVEFRGASVGTAGVCDSGRMTSAWWGVRCGGKVVASDAKCPASTDSGAAPGDGDVWFADGGGVAEARLSSLVPFR